MKPNLWRRFRNQAVWKQVVAWVAAAFVLLIVIGVAARGGNTKNHNAAVVSPTTAEPSPTTAKANPTTAAPTTATRPTTTTPTTIPATTLAPVILPPATVASPTGAACRSGNPLANVYHPDRLTVVRACMTVTGTVESVSDEDDGDTHFDVALDAAFVSLLKPANYSDQHGWLVAEIVPADKPGCIPGQPPRPAVGTYNYGTCTGVDEIAPPVGTHVTVTGPYVLDEDHGGWAEIHPVWQVAGTSTAVPTPAPTVTPPLIPPTTLAPAAAVRIVSVSSPVAAGSGAILIAQTSPQAVCNLSVTLPSGRQSRSSGLGAATADATGRVQWAWRTGSSTKPGTATATVTCGAASAIRAFQITS